MNTPKLFFTTLVNALRTKDDAKALRQHMNDVNAKHFGNTQKPAKLFAYFADMMGTSNANKLSALLDEKVSDNFDDPATSISTLLSPMMSRVARVGEVGRVISGSDPAPSWFMNLPLLTIKTTGYTDDPEKTTCYLGVIINVEYSRAFGKLIVDATLALFDDADLSACDIGYEVELETQNDITEYFSSEMEMGFGQATSISLHEGGKLFSSLTGLTTSTFDEGDEPIIPFLVNGIGHELIRTLSPVCDLTLNCGDIACQQMFLASGKIEKR